jgi:hypothetical protein
MSYVWLLSLGKRDEGHSPISIHKTKKLAVVRTKEIIQTMAPGKKYTKKHDKDRLRTCYHFNDNYYVSIQRWLVED